MPATLRVSPAEFGSWKKVFGHSHLYSYFRGCGSSTGHHQAGKDRPSRKFHNNPETVVFNCQDKSQVQVILLAPDLVRIRVSFGKPIPAKDHSWAIAKN